MGVKDRCKNVFNRLFRRNSNQVINTPVTMIQELKPDRFYCSICLHLLKNPYTHGKCKHPFCMECIKKWKKNVHQTDHDKCPLCRGELPNDEDFEVDEKLKSEIEQICERNHVTIDAHNTKLDEYTKESYYTIAKYQKNYSKKYIRRQRLRYHYWKYKCSCGYCYNQDSCGSCCNQDSCGCCCNQDSCVRCCEKIEANQICCLCFEVSVLSCSGGVAYASGWGPAAVFCTLTQIIGGFCCQAFLANDPPRYRY